MRRVLAGGAAAVLIGVGLWLWRSDPRPEPVARAATAPAASAAHVTSAAPARSASVPTAATAVVRPPPDAIEMCGGQRVPRGADGLPDLAAVASAIGTAATLDRTASALRVDGSDRSLAAAQAPALSLAGVPEADAPRRQASTDAVVGLAMASADPGLHALAHRLCDAGRPPGALCATLSARRWAELDPDNAYPWMLLAGQAAERGDAAAEDDAMRHAARAGSSSAGTGWLPSLISTHLPADDAEALAGLELAAASLDLSADAIGPYQSMLRYCAQDRLADAERRSTCDGVAQRLSGSADSALATILGVRIGERLGWPPEETATRRGQIMAYGEARAEEETKARSAASFDCASVRSRTRRFAAQAARGEMAMLRDWIPGSGKTRDDFIRLGAAGR